LIPVPIALADSPAAVAAGERGDVSWLPLVSRQLSSVPAAGRRVATTHPTAIMLL
jgi:hypothetical protein